MRILILNDTSIQSHIGCKAVHNAHTKLIRKLRAEVIDSFCWRDLSALDALPEPALVEALLQSPLRIAFESCDAVVVNGEGTIHHGRGRDLLGALEVGRRLGKRTYLINAVIEAVPDFHDTLRNLTVIFVREPRSEQAITELGGRAWVVPDSILSASFDPGADDLYRDKILVTDWHGSLSDTVGTALQSFKADSLDSVIAWPMAGPASNAWERALPQARAARAIVTARHHGAYLAAMAGTPFVCLHSNSHKIKGFLDLIDERIPICTTVAEIKEGLAVVETSRGLFSRIAGKLLKRNPIEEIAAAILVGVPPSHEQPSSPLTCGPYLSERFRMIAASRRPLAETVASASSFSARASDAGVDSPRLATALGEASACLVDDREQRRALIILRHLLEKSDDDAYFVQLSATSRRYGKLDVARNALREYAQNRGQTKTWFWRALHLATLTEDAAKHAKLCGEARTLFGDDWNYHYERARYFLRYKNFTEARKWVERGMAAGEPRERGLYMSARCSFFLGDHESAERRLAELLMLRPADYRGHRIRRQMANMRGEYTSDLTFMRLTRRYLTRTGRVPAIDLPLWRNAEGPAGARILFWCHEGLGLGDEIMLLSLMSSLKLTGWDFAMAVHPRLLTLAQRSYPNVEFIDRSVITPSSIHSSFTHWQIANFIPDLISPTRTATDSRSRYLKPPTPSRRVPRSSAHKLTVGFSWKTTATSTSFRRSTELEAWSSFLDSRHCYFVPLQHGVTEAEREWLERKAKANRNVMPIGDPLLDMSADADHMAGIVDSLDLVISVDNTYVHLAGALGIACWCLLSRPAFWNWPLSGENSWYRSVSLFRQEVPGEWTAVFANIEERLKRLAGTPVGKLRKVTDFR